VTFSLGESGATETVRDSRHRRRQGFGGTKLAGCNRIIRRAIPEPAGTKEWDLPARPF
jgi:hypothetical protein